MNITIKEFKIYCLKDPETLEIRYIGVTSSKLIFRYYQHIHSAKHRRGTRVSKWIYSLLKRNLKPIIELIEIAYENSWEEKEKYWIKQFDNLTNISKGGLGVVINRTYSSIERSANAKKIPIVQLDNEGNLIKEWKSVKDATISLNLKSLSCISNVLNKRKSSIRAGGYKWAYKEEYYKEDFKVRKEISKVNYSKLKKVKLYNINKNFIKEYSCLNELVKELSPNLKNYSAAKKALIKGTKFKQHYLKYS